MPPKLKIPSFVVDATLGQLAKYLRLAGFDTIYDPHKPDALRLKKMASQRSYLLTRCNHIKRCIDSKKIIFIEYNDPMQQMRQLVKALGLQRDDLKPMSRCPVCNQKVESLSKDKVIGRVPDYIWQHQSNFSQCPFCQRIFWPGTHVQRWLGLMDSVLKSTD